VTLTDAGPLPAIPDADDQHHARCVSALGTLGPEPMVTTWPCFTEAMHLLGRSGGFRAQATLWDLYSQGHLVLHEPATAEVARTAALMNKFRDAPMDLADASLVAAAEALSLSRVFTVDRHFYVYRLADGSALEIIPRR
jgi:predicted nucleic acid-binding protein